MNPSIQIRPRAISLFLLKQFFFTIIFSLLAVSCTTAQEDKLMNSPDDKKSERKISFYNEENGEDVHYEIIMRGSKITAVIRNGQAVPEEEIDEYKELAYEVLNDMYPDPHFHHPKMFTFRFDTSEFRKNMDILRKNLDKQKWVFKFESDEFREEMDRLKEELKDLDIPAPHFEFHFDNEKFKEKMDRLKDEIDDIDPPDLSELKAEMEELKIRMKELDSEMEELDADLKKLNGFIEDLKNELLKDGYIENPEDEFEMELDSESMKVNGKTVTDSDLEKYLGIYKDHYGKYPDNKIKIHTD